MKDKETRSKKWPDREESCVLERGGGCGEKVLPEHGEMVSQCFIGLLYHHIACCFQFKTGDRDAAEPLEEVGGTGTYLSL